MKRIATLVLMLGLGLSTQLWGQGETSNWYFGNGAGITFNNDGSVRAVTDGKLNTFEGCTTISDPAGDLLFYTDGITVYNQDHQVMENGNNLLGDSSSTQSAIIIPKPEDPDIYYIFTVDTSIAENDVDRGLNYSEVDISMNGGNGTIVQKNIPLLRDCSEKVTAVVKDCSEGSIWLMTLASLGGGGEIFNTFHAFEINTSGVTVTSIKSTFSGLAIEDDRGYLKVSPDGTKIVSANMNSGLYLYDFDAASGVVSNQQKISMTEPNVNPYGVEFSPNGQYFYIHASNDIFSRDDHTSSLLQYDLLDTSISGSKVVLHSGNDYRGALQLGENGKIYRTIAKSYNVGTPFLGVINNPNEKGNAANYEHNAISLNGRNATQGLPPFIQSFFDKINLIQNTDGTTSNAMALCSGEGFTLQVESMPGATYTWEKDGETLDNTTNILDIPVSTNDDSGRYRLTVTPANIAECPIIGEASIDIVPLPENSNFDFQQCDIDQNATDGITHFNLNKVSDISGLTFLFFENLQDMNNDHPITNPSTYINTQPFGQIILYTAINRLGCEASGEITLLVNPTAVNISETNPVMACDDNAQDGVLQSTLDLNNIGQNLYPDLEVVFYASLEDVIFETNPIGSSIQTTNTSLFVRLESNNQCQGVEKVNIVINPLPEINIDKEYLVCTDGEPLLINAPNGFESYTWLNIDAQTSEEIGNDQQVAISNSGNYRLEVGITRQNNGQSIHCTASTDFVVLASNRAVFEEITIEDISEHNTIDVLVSGDGDYEYSLDGISYQDETLFTDVPSGFHTVFVRDKKGCGVSEKEVVVIGFPKFFTPNNDGKNDKWQIIGAGRNLVRGSVTIFDRYGLLIVQLDTNDQGWDGTFNGKNLPASDYWFRFAKEDGKEFKGHFTLKR